MMTYASDSGSAKGGTIQEQIADELAAMAEATPARGGTTRKGLEVATEYVRAWYTPEEHLLGPVPGSEGQPEPDAAEAAENASQEVIDLGNLILDLQVERDMLQPWSEVAIWIVGYLDDTAGTWGNDTLAAIAKHLIDSGFATTTDGIFRAVKS